MSDRLRGKIVAGRYRLVSRLGEGGMGLVLRAEQLDAAGQPLREVALKMLLPEISRDPDFSQRFLREVRIAAKLKSPHTVTVYESGQTEDERLYFSMELVEGPPLADLLADNPQLPIERAVRICSQICDALGEAHSLPEPIVHRDLKPENVFLEQRRGKDYAKVGDFGIAKVLGDRVSRLTQAGVTPGTPCYMSPEQWKGRDVDGRSDLYALGVMLFEIIVGRAPFESREGPLGFMYQHIEAAPPPLPDFVPPALAALILRLLAKDPNDRPSDAYDVRTILEDLLHDMERPAAPKLAAAPPPAAPPAAEVEVPVERANLARSAPPREELPSIFAAAGVGETSAEPARAPAPVAAQEPAAPPPSRPKARTPAAKTPSRIKVEATRRRNPSSGVTTAAEPAKAMTTGGMVLRAGALAFLALLLLTPQYGRTLFIWGAEGGAAPLVRLALAAGMDPDTRNERGQTILMILATKGETELIQTLLERRAVRDQKDLSGNTALMLALLAGHEDSARLLIDRGASMSTRNDAGLSALSIAAQMGLRGSAAKLAERGADLNAPDNDRQTPLMHAAAAGHIDIVKDFLRRGANRALRDAGGRTAADHARAKGHSEVVALLR